MKSKFQQLVLISFFIFMIASCGGAKVKNQKNVIALQEQRKSLAIMSDEKISVALDWVLVRNSPESWAKNADWDEYIFVLQALPGHQVQVTDIVVYDSLGTRLSHLDNRAELKKASKQNVRNYKKEKLSVKPGAGAGIITAGATGAVLGATYISVASAGAGVGAGALGGIVAASTIVIITPLFIAGGIVRGVNHHQVTKEIHKIATVFPISVDANETKEAHLFYPFAPSPNHIEITYSDNQGSYKLNIDTQQALAGLHMAKAIK
jgi:hypothetical protein